MEVTIAVGESVVVVVVVEDGAVVAGSDGSGGVATGSAARAPNAGNAAMKTAANSNPRTTFLTTAPIPGLAPTPVTESLRVWGENAPHQTRLGALSFRA